MNIFRVLHLFRRALLTIDLSSDYIRLLEVIPNHNSLKLLHSYSAKLPPACISQQCILDKVAFTEILCESMRQFEPRARIAAITLPATQLINKTLVLRSNLTPAEKTKHIAQELSKIAPAPLSNLHWDYQEFPHDVQYSRIEAVMTQRHTLHPYQEALSQAKIPLSIVDTESAALARAWQMSYPCISPLPEDQAHALLFIRSQFITCIILKQKTLLYARSTPVHFSADDERGLLEAVQWFWDSFTSLGQPTPVFLGLAGEKSQASQEKLLSDVLKIPVSSITFPSGFLKMAKTYSLDTSAFFLNIGIAWHGIKK